MHQPGPGQVDRPPTAPAAVVNAVRLMVLRAGIGVVSLVAVFATKDDLERRIRARTPTATDSAINTGLTLVVAVGVIILIGYLLLGRLVRRGTNWARVVTWVIAGMGVLSSVTAFTQPEPPLTRILALIVGFIDLGIVVLLSQAPSNAYFRRR